MPRKILFGEKKVHFAKMFFFAENRNLDDFKKRGFSVHTTVLAILGIGGLQEAQNTTKIGKIVNFGKFRRMHPPFQTGGCWNGCRKGCHYLWYTKLRFAETLFSECFQQGTVFCRRKCASCTKTESSAKIVGCCSRCEKVHLWFGCCVACLALNGWLCGVGVGVSLCFMWFKLFCGSAVVYVVQLQMC